jgi:glycosyltransferase involved in cell wall biosynthesis
MPDAGLRVAYFPDSFHEVNGVAHTSRQYEAYARRSGLPFLSVRAGLRTQKHQIDRNVETLELARGPLSFSLEKDLRFDIGFVRHLPAITRALKDFRPTIFHITGPSEIGMIGAILAHEMGVPLAASWHTNVHEYAGRRINWLQRMLPGSWRPGLGRQVEHSALFLTASFYRAARLLFAPNQQLCTLLQRATKRPCQLMQRGVDAELFSPTWRDRKADDNTFTLGYVGRLSIEKNVMLLVDIGRELLARGIANFRFVIVGHGAEEEALRQQLPQAIFPGVLRGEALSRAYANMDLLVFPSHTDTFGNVVLEALASGVPAVVTPDGGPCTIVEDGVTGFVRRDDAFTDAIAALMLDPVRHARMREHARLHALGSSWDAIFDKVCADYGPLLSQGVAESSLAHNPLGHRGQIAP